MLKNVYLTLKFVVFSVLVAIIVLSFSILTVLFFISDTKVGVLKQNENMRISFVLDAGHGGEDGGAEVDGIKEKNINLAITNALKSYLSLTNSNVLMTREDDRLLYKSGEEKRKKYYDLINRVEFAKKTDSCVFISIHQNKFEIPKYKGLQVYFSPNHVLSEILAEKIQSNAKVFLAPDNTRQIKKADHKIRVLKSIESPAVLVECGFLSNPEELKMLNDSEYQKKIAFTVFLSALQFSEENGDKIT